MKKNRLRWIALLMGLITAYLLAYVRFVDMHNPSLGEDGEPYFRSSFPMLTYTTRGNWNITMIFSHAGPANWIFLPIDQIWRSVKHMPRSIIDPSEDYWKEYIEYKYATGEFKRHKAKETEHAGADQPATKSADKPPVKDQPSTPPSKDSPR